MLLKFLLALGMLGAITAGGAYVALQQPPSVAKGLPTALADAASARSFDAKLAEAAQAARTGRASGQPAQVSVRVTDSEMTSKASEALRSGVVALPMPMKDVQVRATNGSLVLTSMVQLQGIDVQLGVSVHPVVSGGRVQLVVDRVDSGALPLPAPLADQLRAQLGRTIDPASLGVPLTVTSVLAAGGALQVSGYTR